MFRVYITLVVVVLLGRPLKRMDDLCNLSRDGLFLGALMLFSSGEVENLTFLRSSEVCHTIVDYIRKYCVVRRGVLKRKTTSVLPGT